MNNKCKEKDLCAERESAVKLSLQRVQNDLRDSEERYRRLDGKVSAVYKKKKCVRN